MGTRLTIYFLKNFSLWVGIGFFVCANVIFFADFVELLRKSATIDVAFSDLLVISLFRLPNLLQEIMPFAFLFGAILFFTRINKNLEMVIARSAGVSVWQLLLPLMLASIAFGLFVILAFNPFAAALNSRAAELSDSYFENKVSQIKVSEYGLWLKQINPDKSETLISVANISADNKKFSNLTIFEFTPESHFIRRIDAELGLLEKSLWQFKNVIINRPDALPERLPSYEIPTNLTLLQIQDSFSEPQSLSFWELPKFITLLEESGFGALRHKLHFETLLTLPVMLAAMVLLASVFSLRFSRQNKNSILISSAIFSGFVFYFVTKLVASLGIAGTIPVYMAAWSPSLIFILLGIWAQLNLEES